MGEPMKTFFQEWQPLWDAFNVFATAVLTICVALLAREQNHLARTQAKIDAQERRLALFDTIMTFLAHITMRGTTDSEELRSMIRGARHAQFLFPKKAKIRELVDELYQKGLDLEYLEKDIDNLRSSEPEESRRDKIQKSSELKKWFSAKRPEIEAQFRPYLAIEEE